MFTTWFSCALMTTLLLIASTEEAHAVELTCGDAGIQVFAEDASIAKRICETIASHRENLQTCGLSQSHPVSLIVDQEPVVLGVLGHFRPKSNEIHLLGMEQLDDVLHPESIYRLIPLDEFFDSIVIHELTHALFYRTTCGRDSCLPVHEYIASVMQIQSLSSQSREVLLAASTVPKEVRLQVFTQQFLNRSPEKFAISAWLHFSAPGNRCGFVWDLFAGKVSFPSDLD